MNKVFKAICDKIKKKEGKITDRAIRYRIDDYQKKSKIVSKGLAESAYAYEVVDIDIESLINPTELRELQEWLIKKTQQSSQDSILRVKQISPPRIRKKIADNFGLPPNLVNEANRMIEAYQAMYIFENIIRRVIMTTLEKKHGKDWWKKPNAVSEGIKRNVESRKHEEKKNRWHTIRGDHDIFYADFKDLDRIVATNINEFKEVFGDSEIQAETRQLERSRNMIAHNNFLPSREVERIKLYLRDLQKQLGLYTQEQ